MNELSPKYQEMLNELLSKCRENLSNVDEEMVTKAFLVSMEAHKNDIRVSGEPYFNHPYAVAMIVATEILLDDVSIVAALLHDVVEDTEISLEYLEKEFSPQVAKIVDGVTKIGGVFQGHRISKAENYRKMLLSMVKDVRVMLVKFADRLHNMRTLEFMKPEKQVRIAQETMEIYAPFTHRFGLGKVKWELEDLAFKYMHKEAYNDIAKRINSKRKEREAYIAKFIKPIKEKLNDSPYEYEIAGRAKHIYSIYRKMMKQNSSFDEIYDLLAVRIILEDDDTNSCYYVLGVVNQLFKPISSRFKDYISLPKLNNYQSIHNTVIGPEGKLVEVQIRTRMMHEIAEKGVAAHWKYKENRFKTDSELEEWVNWVRELFENVNNSDASKELIDSFKVNLYQHEIYVFTPKGDLLRLPQGSTPVDFAYLIHSNVGFHCIGAKVNGKIMPLDTKLSSGDQVEIITSKNQHPNRNWEKFVKTHKARISIRKYINREEEEQAKEGKAIWNKIIKKMKLSFSPDEVDKLARKQKFENSKDFFLAIAKNEVNLDKIFEPEKVEKAEKDVGEEAEKFVNIARQDAGGILVDGEHKGFAYSYAKCCNPIPGDPVVGFITIGEGIKIHRKDCVNIINMADKIAHKLVSIEWPKLKGGMFVAGLVVKGEDRVGLLQDISNCITGYKKTNIKSANVNSEGHNFIGTFTIYVENIMHLQNLISRIKKIHGVYQIDRLHSSKL